MFVFRLGSRVIAWFFLEVTDLTAVYRWDACARDVGSASDRPACPS